MTSSLIVVPWLLLVAITLLERTRFASWFYLPTVVLLAVEFTLGAILSVSLVEPEIIFLDISRLSPRFSPTLYLDRLSLSMFSFVALIGLGVYKFSLRYLAGDINQPRLMYGLGAAIASAQLFALSGDLAVLSFAWVAVSLSLTVLLEYYGDRPRALLSSRKKFLFSRLGDIAMIIVIALIWSNFHALDFLTIFKIARETTDPDKVQIFQYAAVGILLAVLCKSAQFPFHSWLPDTLETPTPVSALMHAGIINSGGYALVRLSPIFVDANLVLNLAVFFGVITAVFGTIVMWTQTTVKKSLAWSTVSQMGFMIMQCGLGAYSLAILHIFSHGLYKANAFLRSGTLSPSFQQKLQSYDNLTPEIPTLVFSVIIALVAVWMLLVSTGATYSNWSGGLVGLAVTALSVAQILSVKLRNQKMDLPTRFVFVVAFLLLTYALKSASDLYFNGNFASVPTISERGYSGMLIAAFAMLCLVILSILDWTMSFTKNRNTKEIILAHAMNGFYVGLLVDRAIVRLWRKRQLDFIR